VTHLSTGALHAGLDEIRGAPADDGRVELIVRRPADALRFVNSAVGRELNLRGVNAKVLVAGRVNVGDTVRKVNKSVATARPV